ncbi:type II toxin-antitoxin system Phd/YefM family antitoxin [Microbacterium sp. KR10-403]|uniref:type II toxin-antitoxin system Phd/YefM family antitoxin n=1 Tax=Microbacterium sp. KR10-403 TaxID=3158581 RepID=UPI0032E47D19
MKVISIAELRHDPNPALDAVAGGDEFVITRYRREVARLVPLVRRAPVSGAALAAATRSIVADGEWGDDLAALRRAVGEQFDDPFAPTA